MASDILDVVERGPHSDGHVGELFVPTAALSGIAVAMHIVRTQQGTQPLAERAVEVGTDMPQEEQIFAEIINSTLEPKPVSDKVLNFVQIKHHPRPDTCSKAEHTFAALILAKTKGSSPIKFGHSLIFRDEADGQPVFIQKFAGVDSALGLQPVRINGIDYPAGTLFALHSLRGKQLHQRYRESTPRLIPKLRIESLSTADVVSVAPIRLSTWAISPEERTPPSVKDVFVPSDLRTDIKICVEQMTVEELRDRLTT